MRITKKIIKYDDWNNLNFDNNIVKAAYIYI
jgi:hypothetical protein